jgi:hypothetical protein
MLERYKHKIIKAPPISSTIILDGIRLENKGDQDVRRTKTYR